ELEKKEERPVVESRIVPEWEKVLKDNQELGPSSVCKLQGSKLGIPTGDAEPVWIRQYPVPEALCAKVTERVESWKANNWITRAPPDCKWNLPLLAAQKPSKDGNTP
ncbi:MAG: hypothetical protein ACREBJ_12425, partial [Nitrosotalea sp.]